MKYNTHDCICLKPEYGSFDEYSSVICLNTYKIYKKHTLYMNTKKHQPTSN